jgi:hypothetical protein
LTVVSGHRSIYLGCSVDLAEMRVEGGRNLETIQNFKIYPIFFKKIKNILWLSLSMETRDFLQKKNILMARGFFFKKNTLVLPMAAGVFF